MNRMVVFAVGYVILLGGLAYAAHLLHVPTQWIAVGLIILLGIGVIRASRRLQE